MFLEKAVAPVERRPERALPLRTRASPAEEAESIVELAQQTAHAERADARGGQLDGERESVQFPADFAGDARVGVAQREVPLGFGRALGEELDGREIEGAPCVERRGVRRDLEPRQLLNTLLRQPKRLPARDEDFHAGRARQDTICARSRALEDVLAVVEHEQHLSVAKVLAHNGGHVRRVALKAEYLGDGIDRPIRVRQRRQVDQPDAVAKRLERRFGDGEGDGGLSDAAGAHDRDQPGLLEIASNGGDRIGAPEDARRRERQVVVRGRRGACLEREIDRCDDLHGSHEPIAAPDDRGDVLDSVRASLEHAPEGCHVDLQVALVDGRVRPDLGEQLALRHEVTRALHERSQDVEGAAPDANRLLVPEQQLPLREQHEGSEGEGPR
ncbi:hypothetical protein WME79_12420 [Sorangium sp. So ce726]